MRQPPALASQLGTDASIKLTQNASLPCTMLCSVAWRQHPRTKPKPCNSWSRDRVLEFLCVIYQKWNKVASEFRRTSQSNFPLAQLIWWVLLLLFFFKTWVNCFCFITRSDGRVNHTAVDARVRALRATSLNKRQLMLTSGWIITALSNEIFGKKRKWGGVKKAVVIYGGGDLALSVCSISFQRWHIF